jgi:O-acetyl-ADP-ribose deacetylase (regulator of RNase III)
MTIKYVKGDLFAAPEDILVHGCNSHGVMGSGVAKIVREKYPEVFDTYHYQCGRFQNQRRTLLGHNINVRANDGKLIVNAITQLDMGGAGTRWVSYDAVDDCMASLEAIAMPMIGAGLGGGIWKVIESIVEHRLQNHPVTVYVL